MVLSALNATASRPNLQCGRILNSSKFHLPVLIISKFGLILIKNSYLTFNIIFPILSPWERLAKCFIAQELVTLNWIIRPSPKSNTARFYAFSDYLLISWRCNKNGLCPGQVLWPRYQQVWSSFDKKWNCYVRDNILSIVSPWRDIFVSKRQVSRHWIIWPDPHSNSPESSHLSWIPAS